ncbi:MAG: hypothetical protein APF77_12315 [Clostridia bacterium BRH_c25]|nr:MAG: hypothetical protein APF77_12315 [Clostridia bacterium BRH_c25]
MEKAYDARNRLIGYVDENIIYDASRNIVGYTDGYVIYDKYSNPLVYVYDGYVRAINGMPLGYYDGYKLYDMNGRYLGYGNFGFFGLLGAALLIIGLGSLFWPIWWW